MMVSNFMLVNSDTPSVYAPQKPDDSSAALSLSECYLRVETKTPCALWDEKRSHDQGTDLLENEKVLTSHRWVFET